MRKRVGEDAGERPGRRERRHVDDVRREEAPGPQHASDLGHRQEGIGEPHHAVVTEHEVERCGAERQSLPVALHDRESEAGLLEMHRGVPQLGHREVEPRHRRAAHRDLDPELARAAAEFQRTNTIDVAERTDLVLSCVEDPPPEPVPAVQLRAIAVLVLVRFALPVLAVLAYVFVRLRRHRSSHPPWRS
jgi:hypothetical protein